MLNSSQEKQALIYFEASQNSLVAAGALLYCLVYDAKVEK